MVFQLQQNVLLKHLIIRQSKVKVFFAQSVCITVAPYASANACTCFAPAIPPAIADFHLH
jgi:hypothetical protein